ncbi:phiSA1p31-related protein [Kitasatospora sp. NPDC088779]|uniref:phiSA1p31-related protein n=1 Tax=Kitasatospora sp. NPDC088779 TaxID=3154964 RepID=UPI0034331C24
MSKTPEKDVHRYRDGQIPLRSTRLQDTGPQGITRAVIDRTPIVYQGTTYDIGSSYSDRDGTVWFFEDTVSSEDGTPHVSSSADAYLNSLARVIKEWGPLTLHCAGRRHSRLLRRSVHRHRVPECHHRVPWPHLASLRLPARACSGPGHGSRPAWPAVDVRRRGPEPAGGCPGGPRDRPPTVRRQVRRLLAAAGAPPHHGRLGQHHPPRTPTTGERRFWALAFGGHLTELEAVGGTLRVLAPVPGLS